MTIRLTYAVRYDTFALYSIEPGLKEKGEEMGLPARGWKWRKGKAWRAGLRAEWNGDASIRILVSGPEPEVERDTLDEENDAEKIARETPPTVEPKAAAEGPVEIGKKPDVDLSNCDGNAFAILGRCSKVARRAGKPQSWVDQFMNEAKSGDYDHLLQTAFRYFEVS